MLDIQKIQFDNASSVQEFLNAMDQGIQEVDLELLEPLIAQASQRLRESYPKLAQEHPEINTHVQDRIAHARWLMLDRQAPEDLNYIFTHHLEYFFLQEWDWVVSDIQRNVVVYPDLDQRDTVKQGIRKALLASTYQLGKQPIGEGTTTVSPTIGHWLKDWKAFLGDRDLDPLLIVEYMSSSKDVQKLTKEEQEQLRGILKFDHRMSLSSKEAEGSDDSFLLADPVTGTYKYYDRGQVYDTGVPVPQEELEDLRYIEGLDENGKPLSLAQQVKQELRYAQAIQTDEEQDKESSSSTPVQQDEPQKEQEKLEEKPQKKSIDTSPEKKTPVPPPPPPPVRTTKKPKPTPQTAQKTPPPPPPPPVPQKPKPQNTMATQDAMNFRAIAQDVLNTHKLLFPSLDVEKRFLSVITAFARGAKNMQETADILAQPVEQHGVNLQQEQINMVLDTAQALLKDTQSGKRSQKKQIRTPQPQQFTPTLAQVQGRIQSNRIQQEFEQKTEHVEDIFSNLGRLAEDEAAISMSAHQKKKLYNLNELDRDAALAQDDLPTMMGPVEELGNMNITEYRRLSPQPQQAATKILEKLDLLGQESIGKRAEGIDAWKRSPLNQQYIAIGNMSLEKGVPVSDVIKEQSVDPDSLTEDEFETIADLNRNMRF